MRWLTRTVRAPRPAHSGRRDGLAYAVWLPPRADGLKGGVVALHGAGSCKESHNDYARALIAVGLAAILFDQRGHGESDGPMDGRALADIATMAQELRKVCEAPELPLALRGSSMGGCFSLLAASSVDADAVVAICPAGPEGLRRGLVAGRVSFGADVAGLDSLLSEADLHAAVASLEIPVLLLHAAGDEQVPVEHSRELAKGLNGAGSRLIVVPGGHHRSIQHDLELQAVSIKFILDALARDRAGQLRPPQDSSKATPQ